MFREIKRTVLCNYLGRTVEIVELYQLEGTRTCQVEISPFHWHCMDSGGCGAGVCEQRREYFLLKKDMMEE